MLAPSSCSSIKETQRSLWCLLQMYMSPSDSLAVLLRENHGECRLTFLPDD